VNTRKAGKTIIVILCLAAVPAATETLRAQDFPRPGRYTLTVQYPPRHGAVAALKVHVSEPVGRDKQALELFRRWKHRPFIERLIKKPPPPELRRLATDYPETVYGRYARFYLATLVLQHRFDWEEARRKLASELAGLDPFEAELRMFDEVYANTAAEFADLARSESAFPLADQCLLYQARCYTGSLANRQAEAVAVLKDLVKRFPQSPVAVKAKKRLEKLGKKVPAPTTRPSSP